MTYNEFVNHVAGGKIASCYLLTGAEEFLIEGCLTRIMEKFIDPETRAFNLDVFYGGQVEAVQIVDTANAYPMLSDARLIIVKELHRISPAGMALLAGYVEKPSPTTRLVLVSEKIDSRVKAVARIKAASEHVELKPLYDNQIPVWIEAYLHERGYSISYQAVLLLQAHVGNNLRAIVNEIDKILINKRKDVKIEESDVQQNVGLSRKFSVFNLNDAISRRQPAKALEILHQMLVGGEPPTRILAMITRHFINLIKIKGATARRMTQQEVTSLTGIPPYFLNKTREMAANFSTEQLQMICQQLLETELKLKTSRMKPELALQTLLFQIFR
jgi:DNA polymerase-3 subunit delta